MLTYYAFRLALFVLPHVPRCLGLRIAGWLGPLIARISPQRRAVRDNLRHVLGPDVDEAVLNRTVVGVFRCQARNYFDLFHLPGLRREDIERLVTVEDAVGFRRLLQDASGVVVAGPHFGNLDVTAQVVPLLGVEAVGVMEHLEPEPLHRLVTDLRSRHGLLLLPVDRAPRKLLRTLRDGGVVLLAADRDVTGGAATVDFFGVPARLPDGYAQLAARTGARVVVVATGQSPDDTFTVQWRLMPRLRSTGDREEDARAITRQVVAEIERIVASQPEQWVMFQPLWRDAREPPIRPASPATFPPA